MLEMDAIMHLSHLRHHITEALTLHPLALSSDHHESGTVVLSLMAKKVNSSFVLALLSIHASKASTRIQLTQLK